MWRRLSASGTGYLARGSALDPWDRVARDDNTHAMSLSQQEYINNLVERFRLQNTTTVTTPLEPGVMLTKGQYPTTPAELQDMSGNRYRQLIGSLLFVALAIRPDISFAISKLAQFLVNPARIHLDAALRVLRYLKGTKKWTLNLGGDVADEAGFTGSDRGGDRDGRKSTSAYIFYMGNGAVSWRTKNQTSVTLSSIEAEYIAMWQAAKEAVWLTGLLEDLELDLRSHLIGFGDNQRAHATPHYPPALKPHRDSVSSYSRVRPNGIAHRKGISRHQLWSPTRSQGRSPVLSTSPSQK